MTYVHGLEDFSPPSLWPGTPVASRPTCRGHSEHFMKEMKLEDLKLKSPTELLSFAEEHGVENASTMRKQELMFATLKQLAAKEVEITGTGVVEVLQDASASCARPTPTICPARTTSTFHPRRSAALPCAPAIPSRGRSAHPRMASATLRSSRSPRSISRSPKRPSTKSTSTTSRRSIRPSGWSWRSRIRPSRISRPVSSISWRRSARASVP